MTMFDNYTKNTENSINTPDPVVITEDKNPLEVFNIKNESIAFQWNYGDSIVIVFDTVGYVQYDDGSRYNAEEYFELKPMSFLLTLQDTRSNILHEYVQPASTHVEFVFSNDDSAKIIRGIYKPILELLDNETSQITMLSDFNVQDLYVY